MKKILIPLTVLLLLSAAACGGGEDATTEPETHPPVEITTTPPVDLNTVSPRTRDITLPEGIETRVSDIAFDSFDEIEAKDSVFPETTHDKILKSESAQYFFVNDDIKVQAVFFNEKGRVEYSASYNTQTGYVEFIGDAENSWYFAEDGSLLCYVYTYDFDGKSDAPVYTFYSPEGEREFIRTMDGWFSDSYDTLTNDEIMACLDKYSGVIEATSEYKSSDITGLE